MEPVPRFQEDPHRYVAEWWYGTDSSHLGNVTKVHRVAELNRQGLRKLSKFACHSKVACGSDRRFPPRVTWVARKGSTGGAGHGCWGSLSTGSPVGHLTGFRGGSMYSQARVSLVIRGRARRA